MFPFLKIKDAWEKRVGKNTAHLEFGENLYATYKAALFDCDIKNKVILDYGCGGGYLGKYLFENFFPAKYIGMDIAERSLKAAKKNLSFIPGKQKKFILVNIDSLPEIKTDLIVCISVIQHLPDKERLKQLLNYFVSLNAWHICLSLKYAPVTVFRKIPYATTNDIGNACFSNAWEIEKQLAGYKLINHTSTTEFGKYQYAFFEKSDILSL